VRLVDVRLVDVRLVDVRLVDVRRPLAVVAAAVVVLLGATGCDGRDDAAPPASPATATGAPAPGEARVDDVATAVRDAEELLSSIDAELAADDAETD